MGFTSIDNILVMMYIKKKLVNIDPTSSIDNIHKIYPIYIINA